MFKGNKISLRPVRERDLETLFDLEWDITNRGEFYPLDLPSEAEFKRRFQQDGFWTEEFGLLLIVNKTEQIVGQILYFKPARYFDAFEIGYILFEEASRSQGYMTEALSLLVGYLFAAKKVNRLQLTVVVGNEASKRVAEKCGFRSEGILRQTIFHQGKHLDLEMFALLREEQKNFLDVPKSPHRSDSAGTS
jgi:[ribosomal protein S5]-alanine N-acetyltransferase